MEVVVDNCENSNSEQKSVIFNIIRSITSKERCEKYEAKIKFHPATDQGFLGTTCEVDIKRNDDSEINIFLKILNPIKTISFLKTSEIYHNETFLYRDLANVYDELQDEFKVPQTERYKFVKSYDCSTTVIVLDNMNKKGYKTYHRSNIPSLEFSVLAIKELAKFHALSFALKEKRPKYFGENVAKINHPFIFNEDWTNYIDTFLDITKKFVNNDIKRKLDLFKEEFVEKYEKFLEEDKFKRCLCHGDYRPCNILMKEINGKVAEVLPIDYQLIYYGCPVIDLIYFIFSSLDKKMRQHIPYLKDIYHNTIKEFLTYFNIDVEEMFPRKEFEFMYNERLVYGLQISLLIMPILTMPDDNITDIATLTTVKHNTDSECQERMIGIINDFIEWGYL